MLYADIVVDISHEKLDKIFQYAIPKDMEEHIHPGKRVIIPFGKGNRNIKGYVVDITDTPSFDPQRIKAIIRADDAQVPIDSKMISLAYMIKKRYGGTINDALKTVIPVKKAVRNNTTKYIRLNADDTTLKELLEQYGKDKRMSSRCILLNALAENEVMSEEFIKNELGVSESVIKSLEKTDVIAVESKIRYRNPIKVNAKERGSIILNDDQRRIADEIISDIDDNKMNNYLIHGVTGSGKTEVYMEIINHVLQKGKQVIMLIPEISLTYQTVKRFYAKFGDRVSIMNSRLSAGERYDQYLRAKNKDIDVMIGPRSALFTPFDNLGLIVIDEEHEGSYKSEMPPRYDARQVACMLAKMSGCSVILGSASPSVEAFYAVQQGRLILKKLAQRAKGASLPQVYIEDLREELKKGNKSIFSERLDGLIKDRLSKGEQIMLFINRRGYSGFVSCRACGHIIKCPHCDVSMTYHTPDGEQYGTYKEGARLVCHYCGYEMKATSTCPKCSSKFISIFGTGTQKVEMMAARKYPGARILRMDKDTTKGKDGHAKILSAFAAGDADILIGTQMIVKGHDFPNVTLVGILAADLSLGANDFLASETTFELLLQAAGRAGRAQRPGEVVIQTYKPDHYSVINAAKMDYEAFYNREISARKLFGYPPVVGLLSVLVMGKNEADTGKFANLLAQTARQCEAADENLLILGPSEATISKINDYYRKVIYIKHADERILIHVRDCMQQLHLGSKDYNDYIVHYDILT